MEEEAVEEASLTNNEEDEEDGYESELTAQTAYIAIQHAWLNEKFAPEILPHQFDLVDCMLQQIQHMEENMKALEKGDIRLMIHRMEIDRIRFVIASYLRVRLEKIEKYTIHILSQEANRSAEEYYLTTAERQFAKEYLVNMEALFKTVALQHMPGNFQAFEMNKFATKPNMQAYVFVRAKEQVSGIMLPEVEEEVDFEHGSQHIIQYGVVAELVKSGAVQLM